MKLRIKYLRENARMTQKELADRIGSTVSNISKYELGSNEPNIDTLLKLSYIFGVTVDYLIGASDDPNGSRSASRSGSGSDDLDYIYVMGANGARKKVYIPPEQLDRFRTLLSAGMPELMEE